MESVCFGLRVHEMMGLHQTGFYQRDGANECSASRSSSGSEDFRLGHLSSQVGDLAGKGRELDCEGEDTPSDQEGLNAAIKVCAHHGDIGKAEMLLSKMEENLMEITVDTFNAMIHTCTQAGDMDRVEAYMRRLQEKGFEPNLVTFNSVINACAAFGDAPRAEKWLLNMVSQGIQPNHVTYGTICKVFARQGSVHQIEGIMKLLEDSGLQLNEYFFASLISACGATNPPDPQRAEMALVELVRRGLRPQSVKRAIARVVGNRRTAQLYEALGRAAGAAVVPAGQGVATCPSTPAGPAPEPLASAKQPRRRRPRAATGDSFKSSNSSQGSQTPPLVPQTSTSMSPMLQLECTRSQPGGLKAVDRAGKCLGPAVSTPYANQIPIPERSIAERAIKPSAPAKKSAAAEYVPGAMLLHAAASPTARPLHYYA